MVMYKNLLPVSILILCAWFSETSKADKKINQYSIRNGTAKVEKSPTINIFNDFGNKTLETAIKVVMEYLNNLKLHNILHPDIPQDKCFNFLTYFKSLNTTYNIQLHDPKNSESSIRRPDEPKTEYPPIQIPKLPLFISPNSKETEVNFPVTEVSKVYSETPIEKRNWIKESPADLKKSSETAANIFDIQKIPNTYSIKHEKPQKMSPNSKHPSESKINHRPIPKLLSNNSINLVKKDIEFSFSLTPKETAFDIQTETKNHDGHHPPAHSVKDSERTTNTFHLQKEPSVVKSQNVKVNASNLNRLDKFKTEYPPIPIPKTWYRTDKLPMHSRKYSGTGEISPDFLENTNAYNNKLQESVNKTSSPVQHSKINYPASHPNATFSIFDDPFDISYDTTETDEVEYETDVGEYDK